MKEPQRLKMERDLAVARRALYRALEVAQQGAYYGIEDALYPLLQDTAELMQAVMTGKETPRPHAS